MFGLENLDENVAKDLIELVNNLKGLPKTEKVSYSVFNKATNNWNKKEFSYVPLDSILEKIKENKNFAFMQPIGYDANIGKFGVKCVLIHKSGKSLVSALYEIPVKEGTKIQDEGAEITYRKRYSAGAFFGLATEEDTDGNDDNAEQVKSKEKTKKENSDNKAERKASPKQIDILLENYEDENLDKLLKLNGLKKIEDISMAKASELIEKLYKKGNK